MKTGEIWLINLDPTIGAEIQKIRPAIIVSYNDIGILPLKVIVPITDWKAHYVNVPWLIKLTPDEQNALRSSERLKRGVKRTHKAAPPHDAVAPDSAEGRSQVNRVVRRLRL